LQQQPHVVQPFYHQQPFNTTHHINLTSHQIQTPPPTFMSSQTNPPSIQQQIHPYYSQPVLTFENPETIQNLLSKISDIFDKHKNEISEIFKNYKNDRKESHVAMVESLKVFTGENEEEEPQEETEFTISVEEEESTTEENTVFIAPDEEPTAAEERKMLIIGSDFFSMTNQNFKIFEKEHKEEKEQEFTTHHDSISTSLCPKSSPPPTTTHFPSTLSPPAPPLKPPDPPPKPPDPLMVHSANRPPKPSDLKSPPDTIFSSLPPFRPPPRPAPSKLPDMLPEPPLTKSSTRLVPPEPPNKLTEAAPPPPLSEPPSSSSSLRPQPKPPDVKPSCKFCLISLCLSYTFSKMENSTIHPCDIVAFHVKFGTTSQPENIIHVTHVTNHSQPMDQCEGILGESQPFKENTIRVLFQDPIIRGHVALALSKTTHFTCQLFSH
jgi:hypothetical protein